MNNDSKEEIIFLGKKVTLENVTNCNLVRILSKPRSALSYACGDYTYNDR
jgi:hypothetical protein